MVLRLVNYNNPGLRSLTLNFFHVKNNENTVENNNKKKKFHIVTYTCRFSVLALSYVALYTPM